jgi:hypothetical protein
VTPSPQTPHSLPPTPPTTPTQPISNHFTQTPHSNSLVCPEPIQTHLASDTAIAPVPQSRHVNPSMKVPAKVIPQPPRFPPYPNCRSSTTTSPHQPTPKPKYPTDRNETPPASTPPGKLSSATHFTPHRRSWKHLWTQQYYRLRCSTPPTLMLETRSTNAHPTYSARGPSTPMGFRRRTTLQHGTHSVRILYQNSPALLQFPNQTLTSYRVMSDRKLKPYSRPTSAGYA